MISDKPWGQFSPADYQNAAAYCGACILDLNPAGAEKVKSLCHLPVHEPNGDLNRNAVHAAAARLDGAGGKMNLTPAQRTRAARELVHIYRTQLHEEPPERLKHLVSR
jgi:hypothetical protein